MSTVPTQNRPVAGSIETALEAPLPYAVQTLLRVIDEGLNMPEPEFDPDDEGAYLTTVARRMDRMREMLGTVIHTPSVQNAAGAADEINRWVTSQALKYRPLVCEDDVETVPGESLESVPA